MRTATHTKAIGRTNGDLATTNVSALNHRRTPLFYLDIRLQGNLPKHVPFHATATAKDTAGGLLIQQVTDHQATILIIQLAAASKGIDIGTYWLVGLVGETSTAKNRSFPNELPTVYGETSSDLSAHHVVTGKRVKPYIEAGCNQKVLSAIKKGRSCIRTQACSGAPNKHKGRRRK